MTGQTEGQQASIPVVAGVGHQLHDDCDQQIIRIDRSGGESDAGRELKIGVPRLCPVEFDGQDNTPTNTIPLTKASSNVKPTFELRNTIIKF